MNNFSNIDKDDLYNLVFDITLASTFQKFLWRSLFNNTLIKSYKHDFVTSTIDYYGEVLSDSSGCINIHKSLLIATRGPEMVECKKKVKQTTWK